MRGGPDGSEGTLPCPGNAVLQSVFLLPGEAGDSVPALVVGETVEDSGPRKVAAVDDLDHQLMGLREGQGHFFLKAIRRLRRKRWAMKTWSMWRCQPVQERFS